MGILKNRYVTKDGLKTLLNEFIKLGVTAEVKAEVDRVLSTEALQEIREQLGFLDHISVFDYFSPDSSRLSRNIAPPFSVNERVNALAEHLGLTFEKTDAVPAKVVLRTKPKKVKAGGKS